MFKNIKNNKTGKVHLLSYIKRHGWQSHINTMCFTMAGLYVNERFTLLKDHPVTCLKCKDLMLRKNINNSETIEIRCTKCKSLDIKISTRCKYTVFNHKTVLHCRNCNAKRIIHRTDR